MKPDKTLLFLAVMIFLCGSLLAAEPEAPRERIIYSISPVGLSDYQDFGTVDFRTAKANLVVFKTQVLGFHDTEKIYSDPQTGKTFWVERYLSLWLDQEYLTEEYFPRENKLTITKYHDKKKVKEYKFQADAPIENAVVLPFNLRKIPELKIGWSCEIRLPDKFKVTLTSIEEVRVPAGKFKAYHFTSVPERFEVWITTDSLRLPVKIKGTPYTLEMQKYIPKGKP